MGDPVRHAPTRGRIVTLFAVGLLVLDGVLLLLAGVWGRRIGPAIGGILCLSGAMLVRFFWRRHRRSMVELAEARRQLKAEAHALRDLLRR